MGSGSSSNISSNKLLHCVVKDDDIIYYFRDAEQSILIESQIFTCTLYFM